MADYHADQYGQHLPGMSRQWTEDAQEVTCKRTSFDLRNPTSWKGAEGSNGHRVGADQAIGHYKTASREHKKAVARNQRQYGKVTYDGYDSGYGSGVEGPSDYNSRGRRSRGRYY
ncbi:hypothetical protein OEA41_008959 [Lepraria neglecta]|uniref:Uncharacterized protein n=1 Tax=Lepraria neglecta TaxID=209136 RepID=A0AAD9Z1K2_9LECA|nr:hypothetical protein OEA41_008959 [Lepraria neglecta]